MITYLPRVKRTIVRIYNQDIGVEFGIEKYAMFIMKKHIEKQLKGRNFHIRKAFEHL